MKIKVNGSPFEVDRTMNVAELLKRLDVQSLDGTAIAVNYKVTKKNELETFMIQEGDEVEIIRAVQGG